MDITKENEIKTFESSAKKPFLPARLTLYSPHADGVILFDLQGMMRGMGTVWLSEMIEVMTEAKSYLDENYPIELNHNIKTKS
jgi:hypothetical protein